MVRAPWSSEQVKALNAFQSNGMFHPFTCPHAHDGDRVLHATPAGWICRSCSYTQDWAHAAMIDIGRAA